MLPHLFNLGLVTIYHPEARLSSIAPLNSFRPQFPGEVLILEPKGYENHRDHAYNLTQTSKCRRNSHMDKDAGSQEHSTDIVEGGPGKVEHDAAIRSARDVNHDGYAVELR